MIRSFVGFILCRVGLHVHMRASRFHDFCCQRRWFGRWCGAPLEGTGDCSKCGGGLHPDSPYSPCPRPGSACEKR